ncbi:DnaB-like helicase C-terminal domain-containing protein [Thermoactinomyces sp. DSM 45892]|uniref:replicative DNA helicase n=1 Tax=Thermoactinomyces sp. DSM 45892 TaxID=1882753 RepID=UPI00089C9280|nr:DnaB-like helicase C-terminal domain-containing protein [Thermoactinomyces sp. DSM 45892]SDY87941.1 replicative DNA helicase [Thermoactinomyces sp. DSM 45892]
MTFQSVQEQERQSMLEREVIGSILLDPENVMPEIEDSLKADYFYYHKHGKIVSKILELYRDQVVPDLVALQPTFLECDMEISDAIEMAGGTLSPNHVQQHCMILRNLYTWRQTQSVAKTVLEKGMIENEKQIQHELNLIQNELEKVSDHQHQSKVRRTIDVVCSIFDKLGSIDPVNVLKSGIEDLDKLTGGFQNDELVLIAGRTSMGKTAFSLSLLENYKRTGKKIAYFTLEMTSEAMVQRMLSLIGNVDSKVWRETDEHERHKVSDDDLQKLTNAAGVLESYSGAIAWQETAVTVEDIRATVRKLKRTEGLDGVIIDYIGLVNPTYPKHTINEQLTHSIRLLKMMAKELNIPVVVLAQINRGVEGRSEKRPLLSDLKDSGSLEQEADLALLLYRDAYYHPMVQEPPVEKLEIIVAKSRNGRVGKVEAGFIGKYTKIINWDPRLEAIWEKLVAQRDQID